MIEYGSKMITEIKDSEVRELYISFRKSFITNNELRSDYSAKFLNQLGSVKNLV